MKKIAKYLFAALATMTAMSCVKELNVERPVELTGKAYEFTATIGAETKTTLDAETMTPMWLGDRSGNEYISVMEPGVEGANINTYVAEGIYEPTAEVTFVMAENGGEGLTGKTVFAVSPAEAAVDCFNNADSVGVTVTYNKTQYAYPETYDPAGPVAVAYNADVEANPHFDFKNVSALLKFGIMDGSDPVKSVKIYALGGEKIAGAMHLVTKGEESYIIPADALATNWVEIVGLYESELDVETDYYIAVAPALLEKGIGIQFNNNEIQTYTISTELDIERNRIYDLGVFSYDNQDDNNWYVVGNFAEGNVNSVTKTMFVASGNNLVAKNVSFEAGQSFKIYNPYLGETLYANVGEVETDTWLDLTEGNGYTYPDEGVYDIYIDYVDKVITGVALVSVGGAAPEYLSIEGMQYSWLGYDYGYPITQVIMFEDEVVMAQSYDELMADYPAEAHDPSMVGNWEELGCFTNVSYEPVHATSGYVKSFAITERWGQTFEYYYLIKYSDLTETTVGIYSPATFFDEDGLEVPVYDEDGNPVGTYQDVYDYETWEVIGQEFVPTVYSGIGLSEQIEDYSDKDIPYELSFMPMELTVYNQVVNVVYPVPSGTFVYSLYDYETYTSTNVLFDLGTFEKDVITIAENFATKSMGMSDTELAYYHFWGAEGQWGEDLEAYEPEVPGNWVLDVKYSDFEVTPTGPTTGEITFAANGVNYMIKYSNYMYANCIQLDSPAVFTDEDGNPTSLKGLGFEEPVYGMIPDPSYHAYTSLDVVEIAPIEEVRSDAKTPDGRQWFFNWEDMMEAPSCLDFGVTTPGQVGFCYDAVAVYGEENLPEYMLGKYMWYMGWEYSIEAESETSGVVNVTTYDHFGDKVVTPIAEYYDYNGLSMAVYSEMWYLDNVTVFAGKPQSIYVENGGLMQ